MTATKGTAVKEICVRCGMVANVDPSLHTERYGHRPVVRRNGKFYRFDFSTYTFAQEIPSQAIGYDDESWHSADLAPADFSRGEEWDW